MKSQDYIDILENTVKPLLMKNKQLIGSKRIKSPELNPIEKLRGTLVRRFYTKNWQCNNVKEFKNQLFTSGVKFQKRS